MTLTAEAVNAPRNSPKSRRTRPSDTAAIDGFPRAPYQQHLGRFVVLDRGLAQTKAILLIVSREFDFRLHRSLPLTWENRGRGGLQVGNK